MFRCCENEICNRNGVRNKYTLTKNVAFFIPKSVYAKRNLILPHRIPSYRRLMMTMPVIDKKKLMKKKQMNEKKLT